MQIVEAKGGELAVHAHREGATILVQLTGTADQESSLFFEAALSAVHAAARDGVTEAVIDLRECEFMSSMGLRVMLTWISDIQDLPAEQRYQIKFLSNPRLHWQHRSLHAVRCFASELITIAGD